MLSICKFYCRYNGNLRGRTAIRHNCDVEKDLEVGSLVALNHPRHVGTVPQIAKVTELPNFTESKIIGIEWLDTKSSSDLGWREA